MPVYLERLAEVAKRLTPGQGEETLQRVGAELLYAIILENDRPEHQLLGQTRLFAGRVLVSAVAAQYSQVRIGPTSLGSLGVITHFALGGNSQGVNCGSIPIGAANQGSFVQAGVVSFRDMRAKGTPINQFFVKNQVSQLLNSSTAMAVSTPGASSPIVWIPLGLIEVPAANAQSVFYWESIGVNQPVEICVLGYERGVDTHEIDATVV